MKPFLKWAGNKYQIIERISAALPAGKRLVEPFLGSAAVFLNTHYSAYLLADINADLIALYQYLQTEGQCFIDYCRSFFDPAYNTEATFYQQRHLFNATQDLRLKAALFIYLNKHCFNGLCRYNSSGNFNTPFGKSAKPYFPEKEMVYFQKMAAKASFSHADFITTMRAARSGDIVYCDPPYVPLSSTANFTGYSTNGFGINEQLQLVGLAEALADQGIPVIISNHETEFTRHAYRNAKIISFEVQRYISSKGDQRNKVAELLAIFS